MDVREWLRRLGLGQYVQAFRDNKIEADVLADCGSDRAYSITSSV